MGTEITDSRITVDHANDPLWEQRQRQLRDLEAASPGLDHQHYEKEKRQVLPLPVRAAAEGGDPDDFLAALQKCCVEKHWFLSIILAQQTLQGDTLLHVAAASASDDVLRLIIDHFSDQQVMARNRGGDTALHVAACSGNLEAVDLLVQRARQTRESKDLDQVLLCTKNNTGNTPLHGAVLNGKENVVTLLLDKDPKPLFWQNKQGKSALYLAVEIGDLSILTRLLAITLEEDGEDGEDFASKVEGMSPVHAAVVSQRLDMLEAMKAKMPSLFQAKEFGGYNALHLAVFMNYTKGVELLLQKFPSLAFEYDEDGCQPIHVASKHSNTIIIGLLLSNCEKPGDFLNKEGQNVIHVAAKFGRSFAVKCLLKCPELGTLINCQDDGGNTASHLAAAYLQPKTLLHLAWDTRVKLGLPNNECEAPIDIVKMERSRETSDPWREWMTLLVLRSAGARGSLDLDIRPRGHKRGLARMSFPVPTASRMRDRINTELIVATLIATVTFAAGFTVPGGFYGSDSSSDKQGLAIFAGRSMFHAFVVCNSIAMYCSILAVVMLLWSLSGQDHPQSYLISSTLPTLPLRAAIIAMSVAFMAGTYPIIQKHRQFQKTFLGIGIGFVIMICSYSMVLYVPIGCKCRFIRWYTYYIFLACIFISGSYTPSPVLEKEEEERRMSRDQLEKEEEERRMSRDQLKPYPEATCC